MTGAAQPGGGDVPAPTVAVSGAGGFLGSRVATAFERAGWRVLRLTHTGTGPGTVPFHLGAAVEATVLRDVSAVVHCAYDFSLVSGDEVQRVNVAGARLLVDAAVDAGVPTVIGISSISAFDGARSLYGRAKLATERHILGRGGAVVRPGLVWEGADHDPGGMFGALTASVRRSRVVPLIGGGSQLQYLVHIDDLSALLVGLADGTVANPGTPITAAAPIGRPLRSLLAAIAHQEGRRPVFVPVPWRAVWLVLRAAEIARVPVGFRSDSVSSLVHQDPTPDLGTTSLAWGFRAYAPSVMNMADALPAVEWGVKSARPLPDRVDGGGVHGRSSDGGPGLRCSPDNNSEGDVPR